MAETTFEFIDGVTPDNTLPVLAPSAGVPGYAARWIAADIDGADGAAVASWRDIVAGRLLNPIAGTPLLRVSGADKFVQLDGTAVMQQADTFTSALKTLIVLARIPTASSPNGSLGIYGSAGYIWSYGTNTLDVNAGSGGGGTTVQGTGLVRDAWHMLGAVQNGASSIVAVNGTQVSGTLGTGALSQLTVGRRVSAGTIYRTDIAEIIGYTEVLTGAQLNTIRAALQANYALY